MLAFRLLPVNLAGFNSLGIQFKGLAFILKHLLLSSNMLFRGIFLKVVCCII